ncbi:hypothetical protein J6590_014054 [Homalodisca vitripennis]|nr:hypothetical protein J6590_014054 [Homalodisca vitripennis]
MGENITNGYNHQCWTTICARGLELLRHGGFNRLFSAVCGTAEVVDWWASWCVSGVRKKPLKLKCKAVGRPKGGKKNRRRNRAKLNVHIEPTLTIIAALCVKKLGRSIPP